jgi:1D-myo-inositol 3-kinase
MATAPLVTLIGNFTIDQLASGPAPGGSVYYSGAAAAALGAEVRILSALGPDFPLAAVREQFPFKLIPTPAAETTSMRNTYRGSARFQELLSAGGTLRSSSWVPALGESDMVLLCPVFGEISEGLACRARGRLTGASLQGFMRTVEPDGRIATSAREDFLDWLEGVDVLFYSDEDVAGHPELVPAIRAAAPLVIETRGPSGAKLWNRGTARWITGTPVAEVDPTGAGDTFAMAFLVHLAAHGEPEAAAGFACRVAAWVVTQTGPLPGDSLDAHPVLRELLAG